MTDLEARVDRLESLDAIRQLPAKYALTLDMRDIDAMVTLFPEDVRVGKGASGGAAGVYGHDLALPLHRHIASYWRAHNRI
jgi:hypothetical protein